MNKKKDIVAFILFFLGWWLYFTQGVLGIRGAISQAVLAVMLVWSFYYFVRVMVSSYKNPTLKALEYLVIMFLVYGVYNLLFVAQTDDAMDYVKKAAFSILPISGFYYLMRKIEFSEIGLMAVITGLILFAIGEYIDGVRQMEAKIAEGVVRRSTDEMVIGSTYRFVPIIPLLFFITKREWFKYAALLVILIFAVLGVKRGPLLICVLGLLVMFWEDLSSFSIKKLRFTHIILIAVAIVGGYMAISKIIENNDFLLLRIEQTLEGDSSNRDNIYSSFYSHFINEPDILKFLFGNGADSTLKIYGYYAHNDWLEIAINQGLLGVILCFFYYIQLFKQWRRAKPNHELFYCMGLLILSTLITSIFSMSINNMRISAHVCIAYSLVLVDRIPQIIKKRI